MARVKTARTTRARHKKVIKQAKGYYGAKHYRFRMAKQAVMKSGMYAYVGRKDNQIKFQAHRIELGEIEAAAMSVKNVIRVCAVYADVRKKIILFIVLNTELERVGEKEIYKSIKAKLPKYMLPSEIIIKDELPLNVNGKIDRVKLREVANEGYIKENSRGN